MSIDPAANTQSGQSTTHVTVQDHDGTIMWQFLADRHQSLLESAEAADIDIGYSCRSGACFACACKVQKGLEWVDIGQFGVPLVDLEDEEDILTCVAGIRDERWLDWQDHEVVIKRM